MIGLSGLITPSLDEMVTVAREMSKRNMPPASVSGFYFSHPGSHYFGVGRIGRDQVEDYAARKGESVESVERWLSQNLGYKA